MPPESHPFTDEEEAVVRALEIPGARARIVRIDGKDLRWNQARSVEAMAPRSSSGPSIASRYGPPIGVADWC